MIEQHHGHFVADDAGRQELFSYRGRRDRTRVVPELDALAELRGYRPGACPCARDN